MSITLFEHQKLAIDQLHSGSILCGGVGSGKSIAALTYYFVKECGGRIEKSQGGFSPMTKPKDLYIITTAKKRDSLDWSKEALPFRIFEDRENSVGGVKLTVDSWNNISKYIEVKDAFFIFDEQRVVGSGTWVKSFIKIAKINRWLLLTATPGDNWMDYVPVFIANGFYKNRTEFIRRHVVYSRFTKYPKIDKYIDCGILGKYRRQITVTMIYRKKTTAHHRKVVVEYDEEKIKIAAVDRWNPYLNEPVKDVGALCYLMRKIVNSDVSRVKALDTLMKAHDRAIIFYNFNYELEILRAYGGIFDGDVAEWNGHKHEELPTSNRWLYLVQYTAGAEGWNCTETDTVVFYSQNYSYKVMIQAAGRIDRLNTLYSDLYYYHFRSMAGIDLAIQKALRNKKNFNEQAFVKF